MTKNFSIYINSLRQKGNLAYEYNPLYNYQTDTDLYLIDNKYIVPAGQAVNTKNGELLIKKNNEWIDKRGKIVSSENYSEAENGTLWAKAGSLIDLDTDQLNFDLNHPVDIEVQPSYDGSVNLILNDDKNIPRLINSRFSVREKDTYEIVDRIGENDTNIYNSKTFDKDTSLYFQYEYNPIITYLGFVKGVLPVGQYCFYFTYCDADDNESDFVTESGLIPVFIGNDSDPLSMDGGIKNQISNKGIQLKLTNIDKSYNYLKIYYVRYFADYQQNRVNECKKISRKFPINSSTIYLQISGYEEVEDQDPNILNISKFNPNSILTQAQCKNMLFFGNIVKNTDNYKELSDIALRIIPQLNVINNFDALNEKYISEKGDGAYYNSLNIYNKTGYFNQEYYRFGVVFIYQNGTLSNVYNTLGGILDLGNPLSLTKPGSPQEDAEIYNTEGAFLTRNYIKIDDFGWVKKDDSNYILQGNNVNAKGVCQFNYSSDYSDSTIFSVKFKVPGKISKYLREDLGIRGLFFVRQKCVPNILAQCYLLPIDETLETPILETGLERSKSYYTECFVGDDRVLRHDYTSRLYKYKEDKNSADYSISSIAFAGICPDFELNQPYYNQIFNGGKFKLQKISKSQSHLTKNDRFFNEIQGTTYNISEGYKKATICTVTENVKTVAIQKKVFRLTVGATEEAFRFKYAEVDKGVYNAGEEDFDKINEASNLVRGEYSPYLAIYSNSGELETGCLYNIYQDTPINIKNEFQTRMNSSEPFYSISDRYNISDDNVEYTCWRGDCYINQFTHRMSRNFNDPSLPNNDKIIDPNTWKDHYKAENSSEWKKISRSDVNAVQIGSWITLRVRSAMNYALRSVDHSYVSEENLMGSARSFYPRSQLLQRGENKLPDSVLYNDAYRASLGFKCYFALQDINYIKDTFSNRIQYSAIAIQDSFKNNYRTSLSTYFRDYSQEYGSIQKLVGFEGYLLVIFEHGIGVAVINERVLAGSGDGEPVFINTANVLPEELTIITDTYGTQWPESVVKSEAGYVYGVDTVAKKIWRIKGQQIEILSDFKVNKFLIDNISLGERELYPTIGLRNIKTHYNNNKKDIMFTFYDDVYKDEEKVWNLCYNELLGAFITFYSWVPSYSANIDTKFFTFDRNTSKELTLLSKCNYRIPENSGVLVDTPVCKDDIIFVEVKSRNGNELTGNNNNKLYIIGDTCDGIITENGIDYISRNGRKIVSKNLGSNISLPTLYYSTLNKSQVVPYTIINEDGTTDLKTITQDGIERDGQYLLKDVKFKLEKDHWGNYKLFDITLTNDNKYELSFNSSITNPYNDLYWKLQDQKVILLYITPYLTNISSVESDTTAVTQFQTEVIALTLSSIVENPLLTNDEKNRAGLTTDFYLHGQAGIFNVAENLYPTYWYGKYHPFEFEFVVNDNIGTQKIFNNLVLISNKAEPESFHFEIEGDNYDFSEDKRTMYFRQESTKELFQNMGSDMLFDRYYTDVMADKYTNEQYYRGNPKRQNGEMLNNSSQYTDQYSKFDKVYPVESQSLVQQQKSTIFPLYYERIDTYNDIYHVYREMLDGVTSNYDFKNLSGSEIKWYRDLNQFNIITHIKNSPINRFGRLRGNSRYVEGRWNIQIPSIIFNQKNEEDWAIIEAKNRFRVDHSELNSQDILGYDWESYLSDINSPVLPPIIVNSSNVPNDLSTTIVSSDIIPNIYKKGTGYTGVNVEDWTYRKETRIRDKWIKIRVRYSGKNLAVIHSLATLYNISYS